MKRIIALLLTFNYLTVSGQSSTDSLQAMIDSTTEYDGSTATAIKVNPLSFFLGNINVGAEFNLRPKRSITFGVGIPFERTQTAEIDEEDREIKIKTFSAMAGYRFYLGKKPMSGLYFEPFLKYLKTEVNTQVEGEIEYELLPPEPTTFQITSNNSGFGVGAQLGAQFLIGNAVTIDLFLLGPTAYMSDNTFIVRDLSPSTDWTGIDKEEADRQIRDQVRDVPLIGDMIADKLEITIDENTKTGTAKYKGFMPGVRAGLSIGIRF